MTKNERDNLMEAFSVILGAGSFLFRGEELEDFIERQLALSVQLLGASGHKFNCGFPTFLEAGLAMSREIEANLAHKHAAN